MENNGARLEFMKRDESASAGASSANASASTSTGSASASATAATGDVVTTSLTSDSNFKEKRELQTYVVADDDIARIETVAVFVDTDDDPGFIFWLTNKTDKELYFTNADGVFTVNGKQADPILSEDVAPGQTLETAMWFDHRELDSSKIDDFVNVKGQLEVWDGETLETLASYDFKF